MKKFTRKKFIKLSALTAAGALFIPHRILSQDCLTTADILGPYYDEDAPFRTILAHPDEVGTRLFIRGQIVGNDCQTPQSNVLVEAWHANDNGCYSIFQTCPGGNPEGDYFNLRGKMYTNINGEYSFETILPGNYASRPMHIHFMFTDINGNSLVTQLYFEGDPLIETDQWASQADDRIIPLIESDIGLEGEFNLQLDSDIILPILGDVNNDQLLNISDILIIVNIILGNYFPNELELYIADANQDGQINITDIVYIVNQILGNQIYSNSVLDRVEIEYGNGKVILKTREPIAGLQFHISNNKIVEPTNLPNGWQFHQKNGKVLIFNTNGPENYLKPETLFEYKGNINFDSVLTAGWDERLISSTINPIKTNFSVGEPFPNPFNPIMEINYHLIYSSELKISVYNIRGKLIKILYNGIQRQGEHKASWNPQNLSSGLYIIKFNFGKNEFNRQVFYLK